MLRKIMGVVLMVMCMGSASAFGSDMEDISRVLDKFNAALDRKLNEIGVGVENAAGELAVSLSDKEKVRSILSDLCRSNQPYVIDAAFIDLDGRMAVIEPAAYRKYEGMDIHVQKQVGMVFSAKKPVFSNVFRAAEGVDAISFQMPVFSPAGKRLGAVSILLKPYDLLSLVIMPVIKDTDVDIWVMQKNGLVIFDRDEKEIGKNVLSDEYYKPFHRLLSVCQRIVSNKTGEGEYEFYATGTETPVRKKAVWNTVSIHGTEWRVVYYEVVM